MWFVGPAAGDVNPPPPTATRDTDPEMVGGKAVRGAGFESSAADEAPECRHVFADTVISPHISATRIGGRMNVAWGWKSVT